MAKSAVERFEFRSLDTPEQWTEEFTPWCRRSPDTGQVMLVAPDQAEALLDKLADERWDALFAKSQDLLASMAAQAEREDEAGLTEELDPDSLL